MRTEQAYTDWIKCFILHFGKQHSRDLGAAEVEQFLTHLAVNGRVTARKQNQVKSALLFLYKEVLVIAHVEILRGSDTLRSLKFRMVSDFSKSPPGRPEAV